MFTSRTTTKKPGVSNCPSCPMSSVSAWSTAAAVRGTTARARQEAPVISAVIDGEILDFSAVFFLPDQGGNESG